jgi:hypothetical protein
MNRHIKKEMLEMKHIYLGSKVRIKYYLGYEKRYLNPRYSIAYSFHELDNREIIFDSDETDSLGCVSSTNTHLEWCEVASTENSLKELEVGDQVYIKSESYKVINKSYGLDGDVIYYTDHKEIIEDVESQFFAEKEFKKREQYLADKEAKKIEEIYEEKAAISFEPTIEFGENKKSWWKKMFS